VESVLAPACPPADRTVCLTTPERYAFTSAWLDWEVSQAEAAGGAVSFHMSGAYAERALAAGDGDLWLDLLARGHTVGFHAHKFLRGTGPFEWVRAATPTQPEIEQCWQDNHDLLAVLVGSGPLWIGESHYGCPSCWSGLGYRLRSTEAMALLPAGQHIVWQVERDPGGTVTYPHLPQIGQAGWHGPAGNRVFFDLRIPQLQKAFLMLYLEWLERERLDLPPQVWAWGWCNHGGNSTEIHQAGIQEMLAWLSDSFLGKTSRRGNVMARFVSDHEIEGIYGAWELAGGDPLPPPTGNVNDRFPYMAWALADAGVSADLTADLGRDGVRLIEMERVSPLGPPPGSPPRAWLLFRETDGAGSVDISGVLAARGAEADTLVLLDVVDGSSFEVDPSGLLLGPTPLVLELPAAAPRPESPFGFHPAKVAKPGYADNGYTDAENIGVAWTREGLYAFWFLVQPHLGSPDLDFTLYDQQWGTVPAGLSILGNIAPEPPVEQGRCLPGSWLPVDVPAYQAFVRATVERYDGDGTDDMPGLRVPIRHWQVGNEPDENRRSDFAGLQAITYSAVKDACPGCTVLIGGVPGMPPNYAAAFDTGYAPILTELAGSSVDVFDFHWYGTATGDYRLRDARTGEDVLDHIRATLAAEGFPADLPVWITEMGAYSGDPQDPVPGAFPYQTERQQAADYFKRFIYPLSRGVEKVFPAFGLMEGFKQTDGYFDHTGLIYDGEQSGDGGLGVKKLAYYTYKKMTERLEGSNWPGLALLRDGIGGDNLLLFRVEKDGRPVHIAWWDTFDEPGYTPGDTKELAVDGLASPTVQVTEVVPYPVTGADVTDYDSAFRVTYLPVNAGTAVVPLGEEPVLIEPGPEPRPVPDGRWVAGTAMRAWKPADDPGRIELSWDVRSCPPAAGYAVLHGVGGGLSTLTLAGAECGIGVTGTYSWTGVPGLPLGERLLWWVIVGTDGVETESSWGKDSTGSERGGADPSNLCGLTRKDTSGTCP